MRRFSLYPKLAASALKKNIRIYLPYLLACAGTVMMFDLLMSLVVDPAVANMNGGIMVQTTLGLGSAVVAIFSAILLFYTNGVIIRRRKREFGLYNILGMEKRHIALVLLWETLYTALISFAVGIAGAFVFGKLAQMGLMRILGGEVNLELSFQPAVAISTLTLFAGIFLLTLIKNLTVIHRSRPVELLHSANVGEREPKSNWPSAIIGAVFLIAGYVLSLRTNDVYNALTNFFIAVILVIGGTYLLFTAFSIVFLKSLRHNKKYYYRTNHFVAVSGMLYRMKRNAMGLASICILSTMVLVTVSTTFSLYAGLDGVMDVMYPTDVIGWMLPENAGPEAREAAWDRVREIALERGLEVQDEQRYTMLRFATKLGDDGVTLDFNRRTGVDMSELVTLRVFLAEDYARITGEPTELQSGEALAWWTGRGPYERLMIGPIPLKITPIDSFPILPDRSNEVDNMLSLVVADEGVLAQIDAVQAEAYGKNASKIRAEYRLNLTGSDREKAACEEAMHQYAFRESGMISVLTGRQMDYFNDYLPMYGAFLFIGMFLGFLFTMVTVTIIYYKQLSEGMDDAGRFQIMQKVGMTRTEVRSSIRSQVLTVFFLPLFTAAVHVGFAFPMVAYILRAFGMDDLALFARCTLGCLGVFSALYIAVYLLTARAYYRIVDGAER